MRLTHGYVTVSAVGARHITPPDALFDFLQTEDARRATPFQLEVLADWPWRGPSAPRVGTYKAMRAVLETLEPIERPRASAT